MTKAQKFLAALKIITKYEPGAEYGIDGETFWFGTARPEKMTKEEKDTLAEYGWVYDPDLDIWTTLV